MKGGERFPAELMEGTDMKVWSNGNWIDIEVGQRVFIGQCGSGHTVFGELGTFVRATKKHCVFRSDSGSEVKTPIDSIMRTSGCWQEAGWWVSLNTKREYTPWRPAYWNQKKLELCYK